MKTEVALYSFIVETTRKCNMLCDHCLRGESMNMLRQVDYQKVMKEIGAVGTLGFGGGEPSLPDSVVNMQELLTVCKKLQVPIDAFFAVTNGKSVSDEFLKTCLDWYLYVTDPEYCGLALSKDRFHEPVSFKAKQRLKAFSFFDENSKSTNWDNRTAYLLDEGRARNLCWKKRKVYLLLKDVFDKESSFVEEELEDGKRILRTDNDIYLCLNGEVRVNCDMAYRNTSETIGNVNNRPLSEILADYTEEATEERMALYKRLLYQVKEGTKEIPLESGRWLKIVPENAVLGPDYEYLSEFEGLDDPEVLEVQLVEVDKRTIKARYRTMDKGYDDQEKHAARLLYVLLRDYHESGKKHYLS